jgi:hypothetical protein
MPRWPNHDHEPDHDRGWGEDDDDFDQDDEDDDEPTVPCPHCRRPIFEDAERCPACERYISREDRPHQPKPWWIVLGVIVCLYVVYRWLFSMGI